MSEYNRGMDVRGNMQEHIIVESTEGETIDELAVRMIKAVKENSFVTANYDGVDIVIGGGDTPDDILRKFDEAKNKKLSSTEKL